MLRDNLPGSHPIRQGTNRKSPQNALTAVFTSAGDFLAPLSRRRSVPTCARTMYAPGAIGDYSAHRGIAGCMAENPLRLHRPTTKTRSRSVKSYLALPLKAAGQPVR